MDASPIESINSLYDEEMFGRDEFGLDKLGLFNFGYWRGVEDSIELAQLNLVETLVGFLQQDGNVLDVACGKGISTKLLTKYFNAEAVTGINISDKQLAHCRMAAPRCTFRRMDAAALMFDDASIDNMLCIEAAFHFKTRKDFLDHAYRVLKPGGRLAMSDLLHDRYLLEQWGPAFPLENFVASVDELCTIVRQAGFRYVRAEDSTEVCVKALQQHIVKKMERRGDLAMLERARIFDHYIASCNVYAIK